MYLEDWEPDCFQVVGNAQMARILYWPPLSLALKAIRYGIVAVKAGFIDPPRLPSETLDYEYGRCVVKFLRYVQEAIDTESILETFWASWLGLMHESFQSDGATNTYFIFLNGMWRAAALLKDNTRDWLEIRVACACSLERHFRFREHVHEIDRICEAMSTVLSVLSTDHPFSRNLSEHPFGKVAAFEKCFDILYYAFLDASMNDLSEAGVSNAVNLRAIVELLLAAARHIIEHIPRMSGLQSIFMALIDDSANDTDPQPIVFVDSTINTHEAEVKALSLFTRVLLIDFALNQDQLSAADFGLISCTNLLRYLFDHVGENLESVDQLRLVQCLLWAALFNPKADNTRGNSS